jgi:hypothetical protein
MHTEGTLSVGDANTAWAAALTSLWTGTNRMEDITTADIVLTSASTATIDPATDGQITRVTSALSLPGVATGEMLPFQVALVCSLLTASATRHGRGRFYLPPLATSTVDGGLVSAATLTTLDTALTAFFDTLNTNNLTPVVRNRTGHVSTTVTAARVGNVYDTQRRRSNALTQTYTDVTVA